MVIYLVLVLSLVNLGVLFFIFRRREEPDWSPVLTRIENLERNQERTDRLLREESSTQREELRKGMEAQGDGTLKRMTELFNIHKGQLDSFAQQLAALTRLNEAKLENVRSVVEERLRFLQEDNGRKLEVIRETVDEKLHSTLEKRLGESFQLVSERLEKVHQGLGEMQHLASGVGDLKKVLSNVKTRGILGEVQLGNLLEQILTPEQYDRNIITKKGSRDPVEFAVKMPGADHCPVYLPIDAKFPSEDYERLQNAQDAGDAAAIEDAGKALENRFKLEGKNIRDKYLDPPDTTDFGILFVPTEGLFAEVLRRPGLCDLLRREYRVIVTGPTTCAALLNSLQMGFRTLAVERRASEVWTLLGKVKAEFGKFGDLLEKTHEKLHQAGKSLEDAATKSRTIERALRDVQQLPAAEAAPRLEERDAVV